MLYKKLSVILLILLLSSCGEDIINNVYEYNQDNYLIYFSKRNNNIRNLYKYNLKDNKEIVLIKDFYSYGPIWFNRNNDKILFQFENSQDDNIYLFDLISNEIKKLNMVTGSTLQFAYNDSLIIYSKLSLEDDDNDIYIYDIEKGIEKKIDLGVNAFRPVYNPKHKNILFYTTKYNHTDKEVIIYSMDINGENLKQITPSNNSFSISSISPNGEYIALTNTIYEGYQIYVVNSDGNNLVQLTNTVSPRWLYKGYPRDANENPVWSPDNYTIAYESYEFGNLDIFTINRDGSNKNRLTNNLSSDLSPNWSSDGSKIIFNSYRDSLDGYIYVMNKNGENQKLLNTTKFSNLSPHFLK